jgi:DNA polymerase V
MAVSFQDLMKLKALGIPMGAPLFKYKGLVNHHKVEVFSANFALYSDISNRLMGLVASMVPRLEVYSIDEAFIDLADTSTVLKKAQHIR